MAETSFQGEFNKWLDEGLRQLIPRKVIAFAFNLYEPWAIEVVGSDTYSEDDPDWACDESFRPELEQLPLPEPDSGTWEEVLEHAKNLVSTYMDRPSSGNDRLRQAHAVAVGFVDGDFHRVWPR